MSLAAKMHDLIMWLVLSSDCGRKEESQLSISVIKICGCRMILKCVTARNMLWFIPPIDFGKIKISKCSICGNMYTQVHNKQFNFE